MLHDPTQILMGASASSHKDVISVPADPTVFKAGLAVRRSSSGTLQLANSPSTSLWGISLGEDLSYEGAPRVAIALSGRQIPILANPAGTATRVVGDFTFTSNFPGALGSSYAVRFLDTLSGNNASVSIGFEAPYLTADISIDAGVTTNSTIATALNGSSEFTTDFSFTLASGTESATSAVATAVLPLLGGDTAPAPGRAVRVNTTTGISSASFIGTALTKAVFLTGPLTGVYLDGTTANIALVSMPRGL